jgi:superfamily II DNA/RNA helicase
MSFNSLGLAEPILRSLVEEGYSEPTPIQTAAIPVVLAGRDLIGIAQTGTGKTAAFALPILNHLATSAKRPQPKTCRVLVLSPTRELSAQIGDSFRTYGRHLRISVALAIGGVPIGKQIRALSHGVDVLVATPGRLLDLCQSRAVDLAQIGILVLDEADRMLDMGFIVDIRRIVAMMPKKRQTLFFSATMPAEIAKLAGEMLVEPAKVSVTPPASTVERVDQRAVHVDRAAKPDLLADLLKREPIDRALVFTRTKHGADKVVRGLVKSGVAAEAIHGNKSQGQRERVLAAFRSGTLRTLVATDIAARGIDVDGITHVFNYDLPNIPESYVHRIGRTARAGKAGVAISFCARDELPFLRDIEKLIRQQIPVAAAGWHPLVGAPAAETAEPRAKDAKAGERQSKGRGRRRNGHKPQAERSAGEVRTNGREPNRGGRRGQNGQPGNGAYGKSGGADIGGVAFLKPAARGRPQTGRIG